jgi:transposase
MSAMKCLPLPIDTARAVEPIYGRNNAFIRVGNHISSICEELELHTDWNAHTYFLYSAATFFQHSENLSDQQMSEATRLRLDIKYALHLPIDYPGLDPQTLCTFRQHILTNSAAKSGFQELIDRLAILSEQNKCNIPAENAINMICLLNKTEKSLEFMKAAIETIAVHNPKWLAEKALPHWFKRFRRNARRQMLLLEPAEIKDFAQSVGKDGVYLLNQIRKDKIFQLLDLQEIREMRSEWDILFAHKNNEIKLQMEGCLHCSKRLLR